MNITLERLHHILDDIKEQYDREEDQAIMQQDLAKGTRALCGKEAIQRIRNIIGMRVEMDENIVRVLSARKRA